MSKTRQLSRADAAGEAADSPEVVRETAGVARVHKLLLVYRRKLLKQIAEYAAYGRDEIQDKKRIAAQSLPLRSAMLKLARHTSGLIENARIPEIDKIELQLRLAEFEGALAAAETTLKE